MKNKLLLLAMGIVLTAQTLMAQVPSYIPTSGLVGYWPFSGNANDASGNGNNGTVNGATLTSDRFGNLDKAYSFDGINNIITTNNFTNPLVDWSCSFWFLSNNTAAYQLQNVMGFGQSISTYGGPGVQVNGGLAPNQCSIFNSNPNKILVTDATNECGNLLFADQTANNTWYFVTIIKQNTTYSIYVDGTLINTGSLVNIPLTNISFGNRSQLDFQYFNGKIDDVGVFNRALTQQEITNLYNGATYSDTCNNVSGSLTQGLVGYWPFCGNANDDSGNGNNGTVNGATLTTDRFGNANSAYSFDGNSNFISIEDSNMLDLTNTFTISAWYLTNNQNQFEQAILGKGRDANGTGYNLLFNTDNNGLSNNIQIGLNNGITNTGAGIPVSQSNSNGWHNITGTYDGLEIKLYIDGILQMTTTQTLTLLNSTQKLFFGRELLNIPRFFNGKLDDIGIWNRALTPSEVTQLYNQNQCFTNTTVTDTLIINVGQLSFNDPVTWANNITIAPNPASTEININFNTIADLNGGTINIINSLGQQVATTPITLSGTQTSMQLATWGGAGMYFVQIINPQGQIVDIKKIILQ